MTALDNILEIPAQQLEMDDLLAAISQEEEPTDGNGFKPGQSVGHVDFADFRAIYLRPGSRPDKALVKIMAGWHGEYVPAWPVTIPTAKLVEV